MNAYMYIHICTYIYAFMYTYMYIHICTYIHIYIYTYIYSCLYLSLSIYIYVHISRYGISYIRCMYINGMYKYGIHIKRERDASIAHSLASICLSVHSHVPTCIGHRSICTHAQADKRPLKVSV